VGAKFGEREMMTRSLFMGLVLLVAIPLAGQSTPKLIALTDNSDVPDKDISKSLRKVCPNVSITKDVTKSDYTLEAIAGIFNLTLFDRDGKTVRSSTALDLDKVVKDICRAIQTAVIVEVVDNGAPDPIPRYPRRYQWWGCRDRRK
jgi:hypothetical protein